MAFDKQTEPLVDNFHPASSMYGMSATELVDLNEVRGFVAPWRSSGSRRRLIPVVCIEQRQAKA